MIELKAKIKIMGNAYGILIPKALMDCKVLSQGKEYTFKVEESPHYTKGLFCSFRRGFLGFLDHFIPKSTNIF